MKYPYSPVRALPRQDRVTWETPPAVLQTILPRSVLIQFTTCPSQRAGQDWRLFVIRDAQRELYRINPSSGHSAYPSITVAFRFPLPRRLHTRSCNSPVG